MDVEYTQNRPSGKSLIPPAWDPGDCSTQRERVKGVPVYATSNSQLGSFYRACSIDRPVPQSHVVFTRERALQLLDAEYRLQSLEK